MGGWYPQTMPKYLPLKYLPMSKKLAPKLELFKKLIFRGPIFSVSPGSRPKKLRETKLRLQLNNFTQKLDFDVLWFRGRAFKTKEEKKGKKSSRLKVGWLG